jgi:hypothetical protein
LNMGQSILSYRLTPFLRGVMSSYMAPFGEKGKGVKIRALCYGECGEWLRSFVTSVVTQVILKVQVSQMNVVQVSQQVVHH